VFFFKKSVINLRKLAIYCQRRSWELSAGLEIVWQKSSIKNWCRIWSVYLAVGIECCTLLIIRQMANNGTCSTTPVNMTLHVTRSANRIMGRRGPPVSGLMAMKNSCFYTESTESIGNLENNFLKSLLGQNNHGLYKICQVESASASGIFFFRRDWIAKRARTENVHVGKVASIFGRKFQLKTWKTWRFICVKCRKHFYFSIIKKFEIFPRINC
jgi:hypothetical protein